MKDDLISRQAVIDLVEELETQRLKGDIGLLYAPMIKGLKKLPSVQETHDKRTETHACDCIDRQAAIDIERNATVDTNPSHFEAHQKFMQFMDDAEISSFGRWQWSNGFNTALTAVGIDLKKLPSAQPEIIRCNVCRHWHQTTGEMKGFGLGDCDYLEKKLVTCNGYCYWAERKEDE